ncbi:hypothetical protein C8Q78DRAFT_588459 [Trametes maxima]|nr:hypothetical protein C8Q78DRAFT_588459 [Trametes maxima]
MSLSMTRRCTPVRSAAAVSRTLERSLNSSYVVPNATARDMPLTAICNQRNGLSSHGRTFPPMYMAPNATHADTSRPARTYSISCVSRPYQQAVTGSSSHAALHSCGAQGAPYCSHGPVSLCARMQSFRSPPRLCKRGGICSAHLAVVSTSLAYLIHTSREHSFPVAPSTKQSPTGVVSSRTPVPAPARSKPSPTGRSAFRPTRTRLETSPLAQTQSSHVEPFLGSRS